jgi:hypothetical protein
MPRRTRAFPNQPARMSGFEGEGFGGEGGMGGGFRGRGRGGFRGRGRGRGGRGGGPPEGPIDELKLYVGGLAWAVNDEILANAFQQFGGLEEVRPTCVSLSFNLCCIRCQERCVLARGRPKQNTTQLRPPARHGRGTESETRTYALRKPRGRWRTG